jgi:hypothetical protein
MAAKIQRYEAGVKTEKCVVFERRRYTEEVGTFT